MRFIFITIFFLLLSVSHANVIINEIMYNPPGDDDFEWIEIYNSDSNSVSLNGWEFTDGIKFSFGEGHEEISGNSYLVLARNPSAFTSAYPHIECAGDYQGKLSNKGEKIILKNASGQIVDEVEYKVDETWPQISFNGGASLERVTYETPANSMADWIPSHNESAWFLIEKTMKIRRPIIKLLSTQPCHYIIDDFKITSMTEAKNLFQTGDFESEIPEVKFSSSYNVKTINESHSKQYGLSIQATQKRGRLKMSLPDSFDKNSRYRISFWVKQIGEIGFLKLYVPGNKPEIIDLNYERKFGGTPGKPNSNSITLPGPEISLLEHSPFFPQPNSDVTFNTIVENATSNTEVKLYYKKGLTGEFSSIKMSTNITNSTLFSIVLNGLEKNDYYDYYVVANQNPRLRGEPDRAKCVIECEQSTRYPSEFDFPNIKRCYPLEIKNEPTIPVAAFWLDERKPGRRHHISRNKYRGCTAVINNKLYFGAQTRYRGNCTYTYSKNKKSYNLKFRRSLRPEIFDMKESEIVLNGLALDNSMLREVMSLELFRRTGLPTSKTSYIRLYKNGNYTGLYIFMEKVNDDFIEKYNLNKNGAIMKPDKRKGLNPKSCKAIYEGNYNDGFSNLIDLYNGLSPLPSHDINELKTRKEHILTNIYLESFRKYMAVNVIIQKSAALNANFYAYHDAEAKKWQLFPWDHDLTWGLLWSWRSNRTYVNSNSRDIHIFYGTRYRTHSFYKVFSKLNDAIFWPETDEGSEVNKDFRHEHLVAITNIISDQLTSGELEKFVDTTVTAIQFEAELDLNWRFRYGGKERFEGAIDNLKTQMKYREKYLLQECEKYFENE